MEIYLLLGLAGFAAFSFSTLAGGGGAMIMVPVVDYLFGSSSAAPVVQLGNFLGRPTRILLFRNYIRWEISRWYLPAAFIGAFFGAWLFSEMNAEFIRLLIALFLISGLWQFKWGKSKQSFPMKLEFFAPLGLIVAFLSTIVGATGPLLNPFYLNYGIQKEELIATKALNSFILALAQLSSYTYFGSLSGKLWSYGIAIGIGAAFGNVLGKRLLSRISDSLFRKLLIGFMAISGLLILTALLSKWLN